MTSSTRFKTRKPVLLHDLITMSGCSCNKVMHAANFIVFITGDYAVTSYVEPAGVEWKVVYPLRAMIQLRTDCSKQTTTVRLTPKVMTGLKVYKQHRQIKKKEHPVLQTSWLSWHTRGAVGNVFGPQPGCFGMHPGLLQWAPLITWQLKQTPSASYLKCPTCWARSAVCRSRSWLCNSQTPWEHNSEMRRSGWN